MREFEALTVLLLAAAMLAALARRIGAPYPAFLADVIVLTAFSVVLGTLVLQGLTLRPLLRALALRDDDPVGREVAAAREQALQAALLALDGDASPDAEAVRLELRSHLRPASVDPATPETGMATHVDVHRRALSAARQVILDMRARDDIGDTAFHQVEEQFDRIEMGSGAHHFDHPRAPQ